MWRLGPRHDAMSRFLSDQNLDSDDISNDTSWLFVYTTCLFISFLATLVAGTHIRKLGGGDEFRSAVRFVTTTFLMCTSVHALLGGLFYSYMIVKMDDWVDEVKDFRDKWEEKHRPPPQGSNSSSGSYNYTPPSWAMVFNQSSSGAVDGPELVIRPDDKNDGGEAAYLSKVSHDYMMLPTGAIVLLCLESIFFMLGAYWIFLLTRELYKLAKTTHDRGVDEERRHIRMYALGGLAILVGFLLSGVFVILFVSGNFSYRAISIIEFSATIASILYSCGSLLKLRATGRKNEHIHGMLMASPLYRRLKMVMIVCIVFTLPYSLMQLSLAIVQDDVIDDVPDYIIGIITTLYYLFGAAQALVMGASQQCCLRILHPLIPAHVRNSPEWRAMQGSRRHESMTGIHDIVDAPSKPVFVNTDIESSSALWAQAPQHVIDEAQRIHDDLLRSTLPKFRGYEITTAGDAFQLAFHTVGDAVDYCLEVQQQLIQAKWPSEIDGLVPSTKTEREFGLKCNAIFKGLRVRMGIHDTNEAEEGSLITQKHPVTGKTLYIGGSEMIAREVGDMGYGGQVVISKRVAAWLRSNEDKVRTPFVVDYYGSHAFCALDLDIELYTVTPKVLDGRRKVFRKRREAEKKNGPLPVSSSPASRTASTESSGDTAGDDSATDFRAQRSPERKVWTIV